MLQTNAEHLKNVVYKRQIQKWEADRCPTCDYPINYRFSGLYHNPLVEYDAGCTCSDQETTRQRYVKSSYEQIADYINNQTNEEKIAEIKKFWEL